MQVDSIKPMLKAPGTKLLKPEYDELLSRFAFKFNLRRYILVEEDNIMSDAFFGSPSPRASEVMAPKAEEEAMAPGVPTMAGGLDEEIAPRIPKVRQCRLAL